MTRRGGREVRASRSGSAFLDSLRDTGFGGRVGAALATARRHPLAATLVAVGAGWVLQRVGKTLWSGNVQRRVEAKAADIPVLNTGQARVYDPDVSPRHPTQDSLESRRDINARV